MTHASGTYFSFFYFFIFMFIFRFDSYLQADTERVAVSQAAVAAAA